MRMRVENIQEAVDSLIDLWADVYSTKMYHIQGMSFTSHQLKPYVKAAFAEPGSSIHKIIQSDNKAEACINYYRVLRQVRQKRIMQNLVREELEDNEYLRFFNDIFYDAAMLNIRFGITFAEAERRLTQSFERALACISLRQLIGKPSGNRLLSDFALHPLLSSLPFSTGSIAGADIHLKIILDQRLETSIGEMKDLEQDLKTALWECRTGSHLNEYLKMLNKQGDATQQMAIHWQILNRQKPELFRRLILTMMRKNIEDFPDIRQDVKRLEAKNPELPLAEGILATNLPATHGSTIKNGGKYPLRRIEPPYEDALDNFFDMMTERGVKVSRFDTRDLELFGDELSRRNSGRTFKEYYGNKANQRKQQLKNLSKKLRAKE